MARTTANDSDVFKSKSKKGRLHLLATDKERAIDRKRSRVNRLETSDDAFGGDEDGSHQQRQSERQERQVHARVRQRSRVIATHLTNCFCEPSTDLGDLSDDDEIYGLNLPSQDEDKDDQDQDDEDHGEEEAPPQRKKFKRASVDDTNKGRFSKSSATAEEDDADSQDDDRDSDNPDDDDDAPTKPSKLQPRSDDEDDDDGADGERAQDSDDEDTWAPGSYHASRRAPGEADSEDDEALELEEAEARRLQKKSKTALAPEDYGMDDEDDDLEGASTNRTRFEEEEEEEATKAKSAQPQVEWTEEKAIAHLLKHNPETLALLDDLARIAERIKVVEQALKDIRKGGEQTGEEHQALPIVELEHQALVTYLPTLTFYFSLLLSPHPSRELLTAVLARLSSLRTALASMEELELTTQLDDDSDDQDSADDQDGEGMELSEVWDKGGMQTVGGDDDDDEEDLDDEDEDNSGEDDSGEDLDADMAELAEADLDFDSDEFDSDLEEERTGSMLGGMDDAELEALMQEMKGDRSADALIAKVKAVQAAKMAAKASSSKKPTEASMALQGSEKDKPKQPKKPKKQVVIPELPALSSTPSSRKKASRGHASGADDYLDPTSLAHGDSTDKASTRHSLRFHVSQVSQKEKRRNEGNGRRVGGDDDLPRRSNENARREVLKRQQHGVATSATGAALDDDDWGEDDLRAAKTVRDSNPGGEDGSSGLDYYDQVEAESKAGRQAKKSKYDEERKAEKEEIMSLADSSVDGPRGATRMIMANKGLTPRRSKASRNSRVKKRLQYDKALKKVASMKAVYKGGNRSNYEGERSGIGKNTVKSVRLNK
ncbi:BQ2448_7758 [Microbotryum intermedium]|uniref:BQ2448_7758 protein n=1 Tax=Microbotryum intermedium TaxID=269621 RepID=A0A238FPN7_9BASI|nr:BQ2448_7758 [Microbotryum intermedium]